MLSVIVLMGLVTCVVCVFGVVRWRRGWTASPADDVPEEPRFGTLGGTSCMSLMLAFFPFSLATPASSGWR